MRKHEVANCGRSVSSPDEIEHEETRAMIRRRVASLPESYRSVLELRDLEELSTKETARRLGLSAGAVKTRLHRARLALRPLLEPALD